MGGDRKLYVLPSLFCVGAAQPALSGAVGVERYAWPAYTVGIGEPVCELAAVTAEPPDEPLHPAKPA